MTVSIRTVSLMTVSLLTLSLMTLSLVAVSLLTVSRQSDFPRNCRLFRGAPTLLVKSATGSKSKTT